MTRFRRALLTKRLRKYSRVNCGIYFFNATHENVFSISSQKLEFFLPKLKSLL